MTRVTSPRVILGGVSRRFGDQESLTTMRARNPKAFKEAGATVGGFAAADGKYQVIRDLSETAKRLAAQK